MLKPLKCFFIPVALLPLVVYAQKATLVNSTERCWSGGIAGHHGCNYTFSIEFDAALRMPAPDTLWIGDYPIALRGKDDSLNTEANMTVTRTKNRVRLEIRASTRFDDYEDRYRPYGPGENAPPPKPKPPIKYQGVGLLSYSYDGKKKYFTVTKIMQRFPHANYP